ncbi:hypothetical protein IFM89_022374 [Coptis chinensis]|uniref:Factor of DNA methylation 1-5/IDN2 domain-containing protein n=1 Tax=Coptis chinensis TaxID=261450 RepID=A0A835GXL0_9MAGN|nr:hypothetical protein IFM89_022374 [Coptis chinensis]
MSALIMETEDGVVDFADHHAQKELREKVNTLEQELLLCKEENEKLKEELEKKVNTLEQDLLLCKEENEKLKEELREKVNTLEQDLLLCKEENEKFKEELREKVNTLEQELLLCKEENEKFKEELKKKDQQEWEKQTIDIKNVTSLTFLQIVLLTSSFMERQYVRGHPRVDFLKFCFQRFNVGVWSSRTKRNLMVCSILPWAYMKSQLLFCWDQSHCSTTWVLHFVENNEKPLMLKELVKLWDKDDPNLPWEKREYNESNVSSSMILLIKHCLIPAHTAIFPTSYDIRDKNDN